MDIDSLLKRRESRGSHPKKLGKPSTTKKIEEFDLMTESQKILSASSFNEDPAEELNHSNLLGSTANIASDLDASELDTSKSDAPNSNSLLSEKTTTLLTSTEFDHQIVTSVSDVSKPDTSNSELSGLDASKPDASNSALSVSDVSKPDASNSALSVLDASKPDTSKSASSVSDVSKSDVSRSHLSKLTTAETTLSSQETTSKVGSALNHQKAGAYAASSAEKVPILPASLRTDTSGGLDETFETLVNLAHSSLGLRELKAANYLVAKARGVKNIEIQYSNPEISVATKCHPSHISSVMSALEEHGFIKKKRGKGNEKSTFMLI